ncbi:MAG: polysaccharide deacetylase family protein [Acidobacteriota bacterium]
MLKTVKIGVLNAARGMGLFAAANLTSWRNQKLLILCYHGISFQDEHLWNPGLYLSAETFRERLRILRDNRYNVLPLREALRRMREGTLPPRSVAITFDDGEYNFHALAYPALREFQMPATVYLATYYCNNQLPVFDVAASYLLWRGRGRRLETANLPPEILDGNGSGIDLSADNVRSTYMRMRTQVLQNSFSTGDKDAVLRTLAGNLNLDYEDLARRRVFHLMTPEEVTEISRNGMDIELHTHRHRTPRDRDLFMREIDDNRRYIEEMTGVRPRHFCYPSGDYTPAFFPWLREAGVESATTCELGFADASQDPMELPRLLDLTSFSAVEFEGWLAGVCAVLPRK